MLFFYTFLAVNPHFSAFLSPYVRLIMPALFIIAVLTAFITHIFRITFNIAKILPLMKLSGCDCAILRENHVIFVNKMLHILYYFQKVLCRHLCCTYNIALYFAE